MTFEQFPMTFKRSEQDGTPKYVWSSLFLVIIYLWVADKRNTKDIEEYFKSTLNSRQSTVNFIFNDIYEQIYLKIFHQGHPKYNTLEIQEIIFLFFKSIELVEYATLYKEFLEKNKIWYHNQLFSNDIPQLSKEIYEWLNNIDSNQNLNSQLEDFFPIIFIHILMICPEFKNIDELGCTYAISSLLLGNIEKLLANFIESLPSLKERNSLKGILSSYLNNYDSNVQLLPTLMLGLFKNKTGHQIIFLPAGDNSSIQYIGNYSLKDKFISRDGSKTRTISQEEINKRIALSFQTFEETVLPTFLNVQLVPEYEIKITPLTEEELKKRKIRKAGEIARWSMKQKKRTKD